MAQEKSRIKVGSKRTFMYRGKSTEELKSLDVREFSKHVKSRERRTILRQFNELEDFLNKARKKLSKNKLIKTHKRHLVIVPEMIGMKIQVYNGKKFENVEIITEMLGHRLGEFSLTRALVKHGTAGVGATKGSKSQSKT
ncbi:MAG: ribosomal protein S19 family protein [Nanoarchaeota archaeon]